MAYAWVASECDCLCEGRMRDRRGVRGWEMERGVDTSTHARARARHTRTHAHTHARTHARARARACARAHTHGE
eukprot:6195638-Pleurochrysis_carterae.AAC.2